LEKGKKETGIHKTGWTTEDEHSSKGEGLKSRAKGNYHSEKGKKKCQKGEPKISTACVGQASL